MNFLSKNTLFKFIFLSLLILSIPSFAKINCENIESNANAKPSDIAACAAPIELESKISQGASLYDVIMLISESLLVLVVFFSIIGTIIGVIYLAKAQSNKTAFEEAKGIITNSLLAFFIAASIWIIVRLVFNSLGIGSLSPTTLQPQ